MNENRVILVAMAVFFAFMAWLVFFEGPATNKLRAACEAQPGHIYNSMRDECVVGTRGARP